MFTARFPRNFHKQRNEFFRLAFALCSISPRQRFAAQLSQMKLFKYFWNVLCSHNSRWIINLTRRRTLPWAMSGEKAKNLHRLGCQNFGKLINFHLDFHSLLDVSSPATHSSFTAWGFVVNHFEDARMCVSDGKQSEYFLGFHLRVLGGIEIELIGLQLFPPSTYDTTAWNRSQMSSLFSYLSLQGSRLGGRAEKEGKVVAGWAKLRWYFRCLSSHFSPELPYRLRYLFAYWKYFILAVPFFRLQLIMCMKLEK